MTTNPSRVHAGTPTGGQFAPTQHGEPTDVVLDGGKGDLDAAVAEADAARRAMDWAAVDALSRHVQATYPGARSVLLSICDDGDGGTYLHAGAVLDFDTEALYDDEFDDSDETLNELAAEISGYRSEVLRELADPAGNVWEDDQINLPINFEPGGELDLDEARAKIASLTQAYYAAVTAREAAAVATIGKKVRQLHPSASTVVLESTSDGEEGRIVSVMQVVDADGSSIPFGLTTWSDLDDAALHISSLNSPAVAASTDDRADESGLGPARANLPVERMMSLTREQAERARQAASRA